MTDPNLSVKTVVSGLSQPTSMAFIGNNDFFIFEKNTGKVQRVTNGVVQSPPPLDLAVNSGSERGGLGMALHPNFAFNGYVYLYWTESSTGVDTTSLAEVPTLGNRVDRYVWNGSTLSFDRNIIKLRAFQADANQQLRGNHNGGVLRFGPDGKLFILMGDNGRRGLLQNLRCGPTANCPGPVVADDQFGGPEPDNNHLTGFILRLNDDGTTPSDNPFANIVSVLPSESLANLRRLYAYGVRNGFGLGFDPYSGNLWDQENGDDAFDEMNRVTAGSNNGWIQMMGPNSRVAQFKQIESATVRRFAATALVAHADREYAGSGAGESLHASRRALQRSGIQLEIRDTGIASGLCSGKGTWPAVRGQHVRGRRAHFSGGRLSFQIQAHSGPAAFSVQRCPPRGSGRR
jgi:glucose/arabinose dehydrogenase